MKEDIARAAARDVGDQSMKKAGRSSWNRADYNAAAAAFNDLCPPTDAEAGFARSRMKLKTGRPPSGKMPGKAILVRQYVKEGRSVRDVADAVGCSKDMIHRALKQYGIAIRSNARRSRLRDVNLALILADIKTKGIVATAKALGVDPATLRHHVKVRQG